MFKPLGIAVAVTLTVIFLGGNLYLGRFVIVYLKSNYKLFVDELPKLLRTRDKFLSISMQCDWICYYCTWVLHCDVGTSEREEHGSGK